MFMICEAHFSQYGLITQCADSQVNAVLKGNSKLTFLEDAFSQKSWFIRHLSVTAVCLQVYNHLIWMQP